MNATLPNTETQETAAVGPIATGIEPESKDALWWHGRCVLYAFGGALHTKVPIRAANMARTNDTVPICAAIVGAR